MSCRRVDMHTTRYNLGLLYCAREETRVLSSSWS